jgi:hypothetical protein
MINPQGHTAYFKDTAGDQYALIINPCGKLPLWTVAIRSINGHIDRNMGAYATSRIMELIKIISDPEYKRDFSHFFYNNNNKELLLNIDLGFNSPTEDRYLMINLKERENMKQQLSHLPVLHAVGALEPEHMKRHSL